LKYQTCDVELLTVHFRVLQEVTYKGEIQLLDAEGEAQQISTKMYVY
jgi:hypothetical protein